MRVFWASESHCNRLAELAASSGTSLYTAPSSSVGEISNASPLCNQSFVKNQPGRPGNQSQRPSASALVLSPLERAAASDFFHLSRFSRMQRALFSLLSKDASTQFRRRIISQHRSLRIRNKGPHLPS